MRLYDEEHGSGTPILGINGAGSSAVFWEDAAGRLAELGRAIVYDRRGCSRMSAPRADGGLDAAAQLLEPRVVLRPDVLAFVAALVRP